MTAAQQWLIANWKMNGDLAKVKAYATALGETADRLPAHLTPVFCPPMPYVIAAQWAAKNSKLALGAQDCHAKTNGAHTGEVSAAMLADIGCRYVIVGHSERRAAGETNEQVSAKAEAAMAAGLTAVICIGETREEYDAKQTTQALDSQLAHIAQLSAKTYIVAYEPIWAIGASATPSMAEISQVHRHIKSTLGSATAVLYGGSVNAGNGMEILALAEVSGALIGGASLDIESMRAIIAAAPQGE